jgi:hypothetical protein
VNDSATVITDGVFDIVYALDFAHCVQRVMTAIRALKLTSLINKSLS